MRSLSDVVSSWRLSLLLLLLAACASKPLLQVSARMKQQNIDCTNLGQTHTSVWHAGRHIEPIPLCAKFLPSLRNSAGREAHRDLNLCHPNVFSKLLAPLLARERLNYIAESHVNLNSK